MFRNCLFALDETDLRAPLRAGASDEELAPAIRTGLWTKWSGHRINHPDFVQPRSMSIYRRLTELLRGSATPIAASPRVHFDLEA